MSRHLLQQTKHTCSIPVFLAPAFSSTPCLPSVRSFSSTAASQEQPKRGIRDMNRKRGVSVIRSTGYRHRRSMKEHEFLLPTPAANASELRASFETNPNHGLWGFFGPKKEVVIPPAEEIAHGRPWAKSELSKKGWHDLHRLYWVCVKEVNMVRTRHVERKRLRIGTGDTEGDQRIKNIFQTMHRIRQTLIDRHYANFDASLLLQEKNLFELFPDLLQKYIPDESGPLEEEQAAQNFAPSINDTSTSAGSVATNMSQLDNISEVGKREERQRVTE